MFIVDANLKCNFENRPEGPCTYCYNTALRRERQDKETTNVAAIEAILRKEFPKRRGAIILHGGEPLYMKKDDLEKLLKISFELRGQSAIQTNGTLVTDQHVALFKKYKTHLGVSIDGYWPANRWRGKTKKGTDLVIKNILKLKKAGIPVGALFTLHKDNIVPKMMNYIEKLIFDFAKEGVHSKVNLIYHPDPEIEISTDQAKQAYLRLADFIFYHNLSNVSPFQSIINGLLGRINECMFKSCDPFATTATHVSAQGVPTICSRFNWEVFHQGLEQTMLRWNILRQTDCKGCRYGGTVCFGGCPAVARDWDWRNKDRFCGAYFALFEFFEKKLKILLPGIPLKTEPGFRPIFSRIRRSACAPGGGDSIKKSSQQNEVIKK